MASLTQAQKERIKHLFAQGGWTKLSLANNFGVSPRTIGRVLDEGVLKSKGFNVGDIIVGTSNPGAVYAFTTNKCKMKVLPTTNHLMKVKILEHTEEPEQVGQEYHVNEQYFELFKEPVVEELLVKEPVKSSKFKVGDIVIGTPEADEEYAITTSEATMLVKHIGEKCIDGNYLIDVELLDTNDEEYESYVGNTYAVFSQHFVKIEKESEESEKVEEPTKQVVEEPTKFIITETTVVLMFKGEMKLVDKSHPYFKEIKNEVEHGNYSKANELMDIKKSIESFSEGALNIEKGAIYYRGNRVHNALTQKIIDMMADGNEAFKSFAAFLGKVLENPSLSTRERLMEFAAAEDIKISKEGSLICYKNVGDSYKPSRSGMWETVDGEWKYFPHHYYSNLIGDICEMPRSEVDDVDSNTCSTGLHVMSLHYAKACWGTNGHTMVVEVHPKDFVSIPTDYNFSKARVCKYEVVAELSREELDELMKNL